MKRIGLLLCCLSASVSAETVIWTATGTVSSANGTFATGGVAAGQTVQIECSYDSEAGFHPLSDCCGTVVRNYWMDLDLNIQVTIDARTWSGAVASAPSGSTLPYTFHTQFRSSTSSEWVKARVDEDDNGVFSQFPLSLGGDADSVFLQFNGTNFLTDGIHSSDIDESQLSSGSGIIASGAPGSQQQIIFTIDPSSVVVEGQTAVPTPPLAIGLDGDTLTLSWQSVDQVQYKIQSSNDLRPGSWFDFINATGDGSVVERSFTKLFPTEFYRIEVVGGP